MKSVSVGSTEVEGREVREIEESVCFCMWGEYMDLRPNTEWQKNIRPAEYELKLNNVTFFFIRQTHI